MKSNPPSSTQNTLQQLKQHEVEAVECFGTQNSPHLEKELCPSFFTSKIEKFKKLSKKPQSFIRKLTIQCPLSFNHVHNFLDMLGINQRAMRNNDSDESFYRSLFYVKTVEKVQMRKNAIILFLKNCQSTQTNIQYLINRYKSFGDKNFYQLATQAENVHLLFQRSNFTNKIMNCYQGEPLSRFIESMQQEIYMCKVAPNKLVISRKLLQLLGEDMQHYALQICKFKTPLREIISSQSYSPIITQSITNIGLLCDFLDKRLTLQELTEKTYSSFNDYLITRNQKKIFCKFEMSMPTPHISCIKIKEIVKQVDDLQLVSRSDQNKNKLLDLQCQMHRYQEAETLKNLVKLPDCLLGDNRKRLSGYRMKEQIVQTTVS